MRIIGITGGIGAGKSEILNYIRKHYICKIYLADEVAHFLKEPGSVCFWELVGALGEDVLDKSGRIDKNIMADKIFMDGGLLKKVNEIVHPAVRKYIEERIEEASGDGRTELFFVEAALLIEAGYGKIVDELWYIYADKDVRRKRLKAFRCYSDEKTDSIMDKQLSDEQFRQKCDFIIDNSGSIEDSIKQIKKKLEAFTWQK